MHDYGKFDLRFQRKAPEVFKEINSELTEMKLRLSPKEIKDYNHGPAGLDWFFKDHEERFASDWRDEENEGRACWLGWMAAVAGHHGRIPTNENKINLPLQCKKAEPIIKTARLEWLKILEMIFLKPAGLSFKDNPPQLKLSSDKSDIFMLAGFCSVCDWLGSSESFPYDDKIVSADNLTSWYQSRFKYANEVLEKAGVLAQIKSSPNIQALLNKHQPRQVQCLLDRLPVTQSLTLIESATGSGKTELALAYAWELLDKKLADSIIFALPTQATANAMLERLEQAARFIFKEKTNLVLAHGSARYQDSFISLQEAGKVTTQQGKEEAWVQCGQWLSQSRKRVFLGQIGVCTIDQVLLSVLPLKHNFVRGFGVGRSVLIVDEIHAYDAYMYGLLDGVLKQQKKAGGSAILLSATLSDGQKKQFVKKWGVIDAEKYITTRDPYPLITHCCDQHINTFDLSKLPEQQPETIQVKTELVEQTELLPDENLLNRIMSAVAAGAQVCLICNLVDVSQHLYEKLKSLFQQHSSLSESQLKLFHSRFIFHHRQKKEKFAQDIFGKNPKPENARQQGHLLIATQVVEQSLDLDFDWMITQLCPMDLLFQRLGRLHRHSRVRPHGFEQRQCTVLVPDADATDYKLHSVIYGNNRALWRTHQLLKKTVAENDSTITFPNSYRPWINTVYEDKPWANEPEIIQKDFEKFDEDRNAKQYVAKSLTKNEMNSLNDDDGNVSALTRDGEMSLTVVPYTNQENKYFISGEKLDDKDPAYFEQINLNSVKVPGSWKKSLPSFDGNGLIMLEMLKNMNKVQYTSKQYESKGKQYFYCYDEEKGFQRIAE